MNNELVKDLKEWVVIYSSSHPLTEQMVKEFNEILSSHEHDKAVEPLVDGNTSDGYHTFNELYEHRIALYLVLCNIFPDKFWKSKKHEDGSSFDGWFILGGDLGTGNISYHLPISKWDIAECRELPLGKKWDGHTAADVVERLSRYHHIASEEKDS